MVKIALTRDYQVHMEQTKTDHEREAQEALEHYKFIQHKNVCNTTASSNVTYISGSKVEKYMYVAHCTVYMYP